MQCVLGWGAVTFAGLNAVGDPNPLTGQVKVQCLDMGSCALSTLGKSLQMLFFSHSWHKERHICAGGPVLKASISSSQHQMQAKQHCQLSVSKLKENKVLKTKTELS